MPLTDDWVLRALDLPLDESELTPPERSDLVRLLEATGMEAEAALLRRRLNEPRSLDPALTSEVAAAIADLEAVGWRFDREAEPAGQENVDHDRGR
jgi:hypothetical protein